MSSVVIPMPKIHETAIIHPNAVLGKNVEIGPYAVIDEEVVIVDNCKIGAHAVIILQLVKIVNFSRVVL